MYCFDTTIRNPKPITSAPFPKSLVIPLFFELVHGSINAFILFGKTFRVRQNVKQTKTIVIKDENCFYCDDIFVGFFYYFFLLLKKILILAII